MVSILLVVSERLRKRVEFVEVVPFGLLVWRHPVPAGFENAAEQPQPHQVDLASAEVPGGERPATQSVATVARVISGFNFEFAEYGRTSVGDVLAFNRN